MLFRRCSNAHTDAWLTHLLIFSIRLFQWSGTSAAILFVSRWHVAWWKGTTTRPWNSAADPEAHKELLGLGRGKPAYADKVVQQIKLMRKMDTRNRLFDCLVPSLCLSGPAVADLFVVMTSEGSGFGAPDEVAQVLEKTILPTFDRLAEWQAKKTIVAGRLPVGSRTLHLLVEADSHDRVDRMLCDLQASGASRGR